MQYNMLIAEDELDEYELAVYLLKKMGLDEQFHIIYARNGKQALSYLENEKIDLLLTDVQMPFATGLEIAKAARENNPDLPILFFSCYDDFSYVKTALSVRACNYLLKPLKPEEFEASMYQALEQIHKSEKETEAVRNYHLYQILTMREEKLNEKQKRQRKDLLEQGNYERVIFLHCETDIFDRDKDVTEQFEQDLKAGSMLKFDLVNLNASEAVLLIKKDDAGHTLEWIKQACSTAEEHIRNDYQVEAYFAVSSPLTAGYGIREAYERMNTLIETRFFSKDCPIFAEEDTSFLNSREEGAHSQLLKEIKVDYEMHNLPKLRIDIMHMNQSFEQNKNFSQIFAKYIYSQIVQILYQKQDLQQMVEKIFQSSFIYEIEEIVENVLISCEEEITGSKSEKSQAILRTKQYIEEHYQNALSLNELADQVYLNASYLSSIFKLEEGIGINEYIKQVRMKQARLLLEETNKKISVIAEEVGFLNPSYFIKSFREYYGVTPAKIRQN